MTIATEVGLELYRLTRFDPREPPAGGTLDLAIRLAGPGVLITQPRAVAEATLARVGDRRRVVVREGTPIARLNFLVGRELVRLYLEGTAWYEALDLDDRDLVCRETGAWLAAPEPAFRDAVSQVGVNLRSLASTFTLTETATAMHVTETGGPASVVTTPSTVYRKGSLLRGFPDEHVRELSEKSNPRNVRKVVLRDEPGRVALLARTA